MEIYVCCLQYGDIIKHKWNWIHIMLKCVQTHEQSLLDEQKPQEDYAEPASEFFGVIC